MTTSTKSQRITKETKIPDYCWGWKDHTPSPRWLFIGVGYETPEDLLAAGYTHIMAFNPPIDAPQEVPEQSCSHCADGRRLDIPGPAPCLICGGSGKAAIPSDPASPAPSKETIAREASNAATRALFPHLFTGLSDDTVELMRWQSRLEPIILRAIDRAGEAKGEEETAHPLFSGAPERFAAEHPDRPPASVDAGTPRTDKELGDNRQLAEQLGAYWTAEKVVRASFARTLERELNEAKAACLAGHQSVNAIHRAQLSSLAAQLEEAKEEIAQQSDWMKVAQRRADELAALRARLAALEEDKRRIDWLEREGHSIEQDADRAAVVRASDGKTFFGEGIRAAIDSALSSENPRTLREGEEK